MTNWDALIENIPQVAPDESLAKISVLMAQHQASVAVVLQDRKILGVLAESMIAIARQKNGDDGADHPAPVARDVMSTSVEGMPVSTSVTDAAREMRSRRLPYVALIDDEGQFVGLVTLRRVLFDVMDELGMKVDNLERELMADGPGG